jgi:hypothetical protein
MNDNESCPRKIADPCNRVSLPVAQQQTQFYPRPAARRRGRGLLWLLVPILFLLVVAAGIIGGGLAHVYARGRILPGVTSLGVPLSGQTPTQAAAALQSAWDTRPVVVRFEDDTWTVRPGELGLVLDTAATAETAARKGRSADDPAALLDQRAAWFDVPPVWRFDPEAAQRTLSQLAPLIDVAPVDATIRIEGDRAEAIPAAEGRALDMAATLAGIQADPVGVLNAGRLELVVRPVSPAVTDVSAAVDEANRLLATTITLEAYDPITDETRTWPVEPSIWSRWLRLAVDPNDSQSFRWVPDDPMGAAFLDDLEVGLGDGRVVRSRGDPERPDRRHSESTAARAHPPLPSGTAARRPIGRDAVEHRLPIRHPLSLDPASQSRRRAAQRRPDHHHPFAGRHAAAGAGARQADDRQPERAAHPRLRERRAQVGLAVEHRHRLQPDRARRLPGAIPRAERLCRELGPVDAVLPGHLPAGADLDFMNGFHGFPTRGNSQFLWTGDLGRRVTYGCILLSSDNARLLYDWAEDGVVVEVRP